ncbi:MAG TPA: hypothetical protein VGC21_18885 [Telluria sp.]|jgi:hypothetical protein
MNMPFQLTLWQKKQAALLYYFASPDYLKGLQQRTNDLIAFVDPTLDLAKVQQRDTLLIDKQWGSRNTSQNWANNAWPYLADFQMEVARAIANRSFEIYSVTGVDNCARGMSEYSMQWTTPTEQDRFDAMFEELSLYAMEIDETMDKTEPASKWNDFRLTITWLEFRKRLPRLPKFRVRTDIEGETPRVPPKTGVYVPQDDPYGSLQFAWSGGTGGVLRECPTFNDVGLDALRAVGHRDLWIDEKKMYRFATSDKYISLFRKEVIWDSVPKPILAPSAVGRTAFTSRPCKWYYVEMIDGEFEDIDDSLTPGLPDKRLRVEGGNPCPEAGYYFTPANQNSRRYFNRDEIMPDLGGNSWQTIWQWDEQQ